MSELNITSEELVLSIHKIHFEDDNYLLSAVGLKKQADANVLSRKWHSPSLKFSSFKGGWLTLMNTHHKVAYKLSLKVDENTLFVYCGCENQQLTLCHHAYYALLYLIWYHGPRYFRKLRPFGDLELALTHERYFDRMDEVPGLDVTSKGTLGRVYTINDTCMGLLMKNLLAQPCASFSADVQFDKIICYMIVISPKSRLLPFVMPCTGRPTKDKTGIKGFEIFIDITGEDGKPASLLSVEQNYINTLCRELFRSVKTVPGKIVTEDGALHQSDSMQSVFELWQKLYRLIQHEPFIYFYFLHNMKDLASRPKLKQTTKVHLSRQVPSLTFILTEYQFFYQLKMHAFVNGKPIKDGSFYFPFFLQHLDTLYLLSSLRDAAVAEWMFDSKGLITIFKEHYREFELNVLQNLRQCYTVKIVIFRKQR